MGGVFFSGSRGGGGRYSVTVHTHNCTYQGPGHAIKGDLFYCRFIANSGAPYPSSPKITMRGRVLEPTEYEWLRGNLAIYNVTGAIDITVNCDRLTAPAISTLANNVTFTCDDNTENVNVLVNGHSIILT